MRKGLAVLAAILAFGAATNGRAADVTFVNTGKQMVFVFARSGAGDCPVKARQHAFRLGPGHQRRVEAGTASVCYGLSYFDDANYPPFATGETKPDQNETVDAAKPRAGCCRAAIGADSPEFTWPITSFPHIVLPPNITWLTDPVRMEYVVAIWRDPLTPPHTKTECTSEAWGTWPWGEEWRTCNAYSTQCQWMERRLVAIIEARGVTEGELNTATEKCLKEASVAAALSAIVAVASDGAGAPAAEAAFVSTLTACLTNELPGKTISVGLRNDGGWTNWLGC